MKNRYIRMVAVWACLLFTAHGSRAQTIYYVNGSTGNDVNTGTSWASAFRNVTKAVAAANASTAAEVQIWIAGGTYRPTDGITVLPTDHNDTSFTFYRGNGLGKALKVYGGFAGTELSIAARDTVHPTYLDGNIGSGNSYHVVIIAGLATGADSVVLDRLTIRNGSSTSFSGYKYYNGATVNYSWGAGIYLADNYTAKVCIRSCKILSNTVDFGYPSAGAGMAINSSFPFITGCVFSNNVTNARYNPSSLYPGGGALFADSSTVTVSYCEFTGNTAVGDSLHATSLSWGVSVKGGAVFTNLSKLYMTGCSFNYNKAVGGTQTALYGSMGGNGMGGAMAGFVSSVHLTSCTFQGNVARGAYCYSGGSAAGGAIHSGACGLYLSGCNFIADTAISGGATVSSGEASSGAVENGYNSGYDSASVYANCNFTSNVSIAGTGTVPTNANAVGGALTNSARLTLTNCTFTSNSVQKGGYQSSGGAVFNSNSTTVISKCNFVSNRVTGLFNNNWGGALKNYNSNPLIDSCTFTGNKATYGGAIHHSDSLLTVKHCLFTADSAGYGGAIYVNTDTWYQTQFTAMNNAFYGNMADSGAGAIGLFIGVPGQDTLINNVFANNKTIRSGSNGGAILLSGATHNVYNNTFYADTAANAGGAIRMEGSGGSYYVSNNIFFHNMGAATSVDTNTAATSGYYDLHNNLWSATDPLFTNSANLPGPDGTWGTSDDGLKPQPCSPARDAGNSAYIVTGEATDMAGVARLYGTSVDIGAYEQNLLSPITTSSDSVCVGSTRTLSNPTSGGTWSSSSTAIATVGSTGIVTGVSQGTVTISYTKSFGCASATVTINLFVQRTAATITGAHALCAGSTLTLSDTTTSGTWSSSSTTIATVGTAGLVTAVAQGSATISYTVTNICGTSTKMVTVSVERPAAIILGSDTVCRGSTTALTDSATGGTWTSGTTSVATVGSTGIVTGIAQGTSTISYSLSNSCGASLATVNVTVQRPAATITGTHTFCSGSATTLADSTTDGIWSSSDATIASVDSITGIVTGVSGGVATITYSVANVCGASTKTFSVNIEVPAAPIGGTAAVCAGSSITLTETTPGGTWSSSSSAIAAVGSTGVVTGVAQGTAFITYTVTNTCGTTSENVTQIVEIPASVITGPDSICIGHTATFTDRATGGTWSGSDAAVATISGSGVLSALSPGITNLHYNVINACGSTMTSHNVIVEAPAAPITGGTSYICVGQTVTLSDTSSNGTWNSADNTIASVSGGVVSGVAGGTTTISYSITNVCGTTTATLNVTVLTTEQCDSAAVVHPTLLSQDIRMFPNPAESKVRIIAPCKVNVTITDVAGKQVLEFTNAAEMDIAHLPEGIYLVNVFDSQGNKLKTEKLVKVLR